MHRLEDKIVSLIKKNKVLVSNFLYVTLLQVFLLIAPLITYPYLVKVLGMELYGLVITAQVLVSYASILINFGSNEVCAKHVSINRDNPNKLSEIVSSVFFVRLFLWLLIFIVYFIVVISVPSYSKHVLMFILMYGVTTNDLLFPQYFFQGVEKMKYSTIVNLLIKTVFIVLVFFIVKKPVDYIYIPILYSVGYFLGGIISLWIIIYKEGVRLIIPTIKEAMFYVKDSSALFLTDLVCTIKDKFNYLILGAFNGMANVVVYDLGMKIYTLTAKPAGIASIVFFPKSAKSRNLKQFRMILMGIIVVNTFIIILVNIFLPMIVTFFLHKEIDLLPLRLFTLAPLFSTVGAFIIQNLCIAYGYNRYVLYSIIVTTSAYLVLLTVFYFTHFLSNLYAFVLLALISYFIEFLYRVIIYRKVVKMETNKSFLLDKY